MKSGVNAITNFKIKNKDELSLSRNSEKHFNLLISGQIILTFIALIHAWTIQYKSNMGSDGFVTRISYKSFDKPWMPRDTDTSALLHLHYFGDWVLYVAYGGISSPYDPDLAIPAQFAAVGLLFVSFIYILGYKVGYILFLFATVYIWWQIIKKLFGNTDLINKIVILFFIVFITQPAIIAFDRGGVHLFCIGMVGLSYLNNKNNRRIIGFAQFLLAVSLKPYLIFLTLVVFLDNSKSFSQKIRSFLVVLGGIFIVNLSFLVLFAENSLVGLRDQLRAIARFAGDWGIPWIMDGASMTSFISKSYEFFNGSLAAQNLMIDFLPFWPRPLALTFIFLLVVIILSKAIVEPIKIILILSTTSLVSPFSGPYTVVWISLAFCYLLSEIKNGFELSKLDLINKIAIYSLIISFYIGLTPYFGFFPMASGVIRHNPGNYFYIPPIVLSLLLCSSYAASRFIKDIFSSSKRT